MHFHFLQTPIGTMYAVCSTDFLLELYFGTKENVDKYLQISNKKFEIEPNLFCHDILYQTQNQLNEYFQLKRTEFSIPIKFVGTDFQKSVWQSLIEIPFGEVKTYKQQAIHLGNLKAIRAVASANGTNPLAIIVPCHRVIGQNNQLIGYAGGIEKKKALLDLESAQTNLFTSI